jgi:hypothetical protein
VTQHGSDGPPPGEHENELPDEHDQTDEDGDVQEENAETSLDQPSQ